MRIYITLKSLQVVILKSLLSRLALGRIALDLNWIYMRLSKSVELYIEKQHPSPREASASPMREESACNVWNPHFCQDLDEAIVEPRYTLQMLWQICFHMASFGHLSVQIWIKPFSSPGTPPTAMTDLLPYGFFSIPFYRDLDQAILQPKYTLQML